MKKNKKAILFSLISVLFSMLFITLFSSNFSLNQEDMIIGSNIRIRVMDIYTRNFETYLGDSLKISSYKTLDALTIYLYGHGMFFSDRSEFERAFSECIKCGYVDCSSKIPGNNCSLGDDNINSRIINISQLSLEQLNIHTEYVILGINITQNYPFEVEVTMNISYNITDATSGDEYAKWSKNRLITQSVPIIGLLEPVGKVYDDTYNRRILKYSGICEFNATCWNPLNTESFYNESSFRYYVNGTSFLQRYWNDDSDSDCCGIETILHPFELSVFLPRRSHIDHYYWNNENGCNQGVRVVNTTINNEHVYLDQYTALRYGLDGITHCTS
jgi:hypothetical protein